MDITSKDKMTNKIIIQEDGKVKELKGEELNYFIATQADIKVEIQNREAEIAANAEAKAELLARLGITAEEAKLLLS
jgi:uncharacterized protein YabE (DUF348 family)